MALEKIGLEAILKDEDFQKGLAAMIRGVDTAVAKIESGGQRMTAASEKTTQSWQAGAKKAGVAMGAMGAAGIALATKVTLTAARTEELGIVLNTVGRNVGKTVEQMKQYEDGVKSMGITTQASRQAIIQMVQANLDLEKSTELARLAQDAAVIAQMDSSEAFQTLITVIQRGSLVMARTLGLTVDFQGAYKKLADELGISTQALTQQQKIQARTNEVLAQSVNIAGTYEAAMGSAGKQLRSMTRHIEELENELGSVLLPVMGEIVETMTDILKMLREADPVMKQTVVEFGALASAVLLVGGALTTMAPGLIAVIGALGGPVTLAIVAVTALVAGITALVIHLDNLEKASQETAAGILADTDDFEQYEQAMRNAREETRALSKELYDLARASKDVDFLAFQQAAEEMAEHFRKEADAVADLESGFRSHFGVLKGGEATVEARLDYSRRYVDSLTKEGLAIAVSTDRIYEWLVAGNVSKELARGWADQIKELAAIQQYHNLLIEEGVSGIGDWAGSALEAVDAADSLVTVQSDMEARIQALKREIADLAKETGLSEKKVTELKIALGYTDDEIKKVGEDLHLTGGEMDALAKKTGFSRERIKELNQTLGQKDIEDYAKALEDAAEATGKTAEELDWLAKNAGWTAIDLRNLTAEIEDMEDALEDAKDEAQQTFRALVSGVGDLQAAMGALEDNQKGFDDTVADVTRSTTANIDKIKEKYENMLPDATTAEQRMADAGNAWDEWAHRALGSIDDVVSGDEEGWIAHIRIQAKAAGIIQGENESLYDYMHRVVKAFYENKIPGLIQDGSSQYQTATAEYKRLMDEEIRKAEEAADAKIAAARKEKRERDELLRQERDVSAIGAALELAEADKSLAKFAQQKWPGYLGIMLSDADTFMDAVNNGFIDMDDPDVFNFVTQALADLKIQFDGTLPEMNDNVRENRDLWKEAKQEADAYKEALAAQETELEGLETKRDALLAQQAQLAQFGEVDPELEESLKGIQDQIKDLTDEMDDGPLQNMPDEATTAIEEVDSLTEALGATKTILGDLKDDGPTDVETVTTAIDTADKRTRIWSADIDTLGVKASKALDEFIAELKKLDGSTITVTIEIVSPTGSPVVPTAHYIEMIHAGLGALPSQVVVDIQLAGLAAAQIAGEQIGTSIMQAVLGNVEKFRQPWNAPLWLTNRAGQLGRVGSFFAGLYDEDVLQPLLDDLDQLNDDIEDTERLLEDQAFIRRLSAQQYLELQTNYNASLEKRNALEEEYAKAQEATAKFERAQSRLDILNAQLQLVKMLYDLDVDPRGLLSEIGIGIDVASEDWVAAMAEAMEKLAQAAEEKLKEFLGIASPSQKMIDIGLQMREGLLQGLSTPVPRLAAPQSSTSMTNVEVANDFSGAVINNGMDMAVFQALVTQTVRKSVRGY